LSEVGDYNADGIEAATIIADSAYGTSSLLEATGTNLTQAGIETDILQVDLPSTDFSSLIARLVVREHLPDAILIYLKGQPALLLQSQLLEAGIGPQRSTLLVQNYAGLDSSQFWSEVPNGEGTIVNRLGAWSSTVNTRGQDFAIKYDQYAGRWPESYAFASYDAVWLLGDAMRVAPSWKGSDLIAALEAIHQESTNGSISFPVSSLSTPLPDQPAYMWHQWAGSQILYLQYTEPQQPALAMAVIWPPHYRTPNIQTAVVPLIP
jgi:ABC-type branched-subunit amino acid transport system substrate-binding protein